MWRKVTCSNETGQSKPDDQNSVRLRDEQNRPVVNLTSGVLIDPALAERQPVPSVIQQQAHLAEQFGAVPLPDNDAVDVLLCEDNHINQLVFIEILEETGYTYQIANNGKEGLELYKSLSPSMIIMDVSMPQMNGLEATQAIREIETEVDVRIPIIGVTAHAITGDKDRCLDAGMDDYLSKPISPDSLIEKINRLMPDAQRKSA